MDTLLVIKTPNPSNHNRGLRSARANVRCGSRLCENVDEQRTCRIVFSLSFFRQRLTASSFLIQLIRDKTFYAPVRLRVFTQPGQSRPNWALCAMSGLPPFATELRTRWRSGSCHFGSRALRLRSIVGPVAEVRLAEADIVRAGSGSSAFRLVWTVRLDPFAKEAHDDGAFGSDRPRSWPRSSQTGKYRRSKSSTLISPASRPSTNGQCHCARDGRRRPRRGNRCRPQGSVRRAAGASAWRSLHCEREYRHGGLPTTWGVPALAKAVVPLDAPVVERMRQAGAIPIARTNLPDMALRMHTDSSLYGLTRNPWNLGAPASGSSGGEAVALATGMSLSGWVMTRRFASAIPRTLAASLQFVRLPAAYPMRALCPAKTVSLSFS